jgi:hypothetical protein
MKNADKKLLKFYAKLQSNNKTKQGVRRRSSSDSDIWKRRTVQEN